MGAIFKLLLGSLFGAAFDWVGRELDKWRQRRAEKIAAEQKRKLEEAEKDVAVLQAKTGVDAALINNPDSVRDGRDPDARDDNASG